jgi:D-arabinose 1-dehydrogenase-like Zn-dependent alcohol dehydrogenase
MPQPSMGLCQALLFLVFPSHEVVGKIELVGEGVTGLGQRVGVGFLGGHCGFCTSCRRGDFVNVPISRFPAFTSMEATPNQ